MSTLPSSEKLSFPEFSPATYDEWKAAAEQLLKGAPFDRKMITHTYEGIDLQPIYTQTTPTQSAMFRGVPGSYPFRRGAEATGFITQTWLVAQETAYASPAEANEALRTDLQRGQNTVYLRLDRPSRLGLDADKADLSMIGDNGISLCSLSDITSILAGIDLATTPIYIEADIAAPAVCALLATVAEQSGVPIDHLHGMVGSDPLGLLLTNQTIPFSLNTALDRMHMTAAWASRVAPSLRSIAVHGRTYHDAGANAVQELAFSVATGIEYVRAMLHRGMDIENAAGQVRFSLCAGTDFFMEIAKLRAARLMWATAINAFGGSESVQKMSLHVRTSAFSVTTVDPYVNMLRTTTEAFAAAIGGCDSLHVGSFDEAIRPPDEFSRRIARNTQIILQSEAHLPKVIDPAGGSWYVEWLTDEVATRSWRLVQEIEAAGGIASAVLKGEIQEQVKAIGTKRADGVARRKDTIVGVTSYANPGETLLAGSEEDLTKVRARRGDDVRSYRTRRDSSGSAAALARIPARAKEQPGGVMSALIDAARHGATVGEMLHAIPAPPDETPVSVAPLAPTRLSMEIEALRHRMAAVARKNGRPVRVFLATMGPLPQHKVRADFSTGFFAVAGCEVITPSGFATAEDAANAACESGAEIAVLCSTDETYPVLVAPFCAAVKKLRSDMTVVLAGYPQDHIEAFRAAGVDEFIHIRSNVLETLRTLLGKKGVRP
jgi:methylmalonyl-CoA mutase